MSFLAAKVATNTQIVEFKTYQPSESRYSPRIKHEEWERHRRKLTDLHRQNIPRKQMLDLLKREDGFCASMPQLNHRFNVWGLRRYEKSTSQSSSQKSKSPSHSKTPSPDRHQSSGSSPAAVMTATQDPASDPAVEELYPSHLGLEGVSGATRGQGEACEYLDANNGHDNEEYMQWDQLFQTPVVDQQPPSGAGMEALPTTSWNPLDEFSGISGYPQYSVNISWSDSDASSNEDQGFLTPGTATPSRGSCSSDAGRGSLPTHEQEFSSIAGQSGSSDHENHPTDSLQALSRFTRPTAPPPYGIPVMQEPTDMRVSESLLRCVAGFSNLTTSNRQRRPSPSSFLTPHTASGTSNFRSDIYRQQIRRCINATAEAYENSHYFLKLGEPKKAIQRLGDATSTVAPMFNEPDLFLLTRLVEIATWSSWKKFPVYEPLVFKFLSSEAGRGLGLQHPLTLLLGCFAEAAAISTSYPTLWIVIIDHIDRIADDSDPISRSEAQQIRIKAYFYLVRVLRNNACHSQAIQRCQELIQLCIAIDGTRSFSANRARYNLAVNHCEAGDIQSAMEAYQEARKHLGTKESLSDGWVFAVFASSELAQLHEQEGDMAKASECYEEALVNFLKCGGDESSGALLMLKDLIEFHERMDNKEQLERIRKQYPACWTALEMGGLDDARHWVGRRVTTQASGGKKWRAWTWTSPIA
ncbi:hypothetical protein B0T14DRAFT_526686 [Immersiella caudata]|uniref:Clr5 domain-containing protein n=1 Tax=Immersiella caudata TaxID=314043 RepID=A0AA39WE24_9PEZI|nr:hypothetical protein B0T14DRAFT_526686 [Immersiella caudata]